MKKLFLASVGFILSTAPLFAQSFPPAQAANNAFNKPPVNIMSPDAASLGKYGTYNVSHYTGTPGISIPIYELSEAGISVPISVSYDASGFIPNKNASVVGQNWNLAAGGVITRVVKGVPDEKLDPNPPSTLDDLATKNNIGYIYGLTHYSSDPSQSYVENMNFLETDGEVLYAVGFPRVKGTADVKYEYNPDIFSFNFLGHSGTFVMGNDEIVKVNSDRKYKVDLTDLKPQFNLGQTIDNLVQNNTLDSYEISKIVITSDDGYKFYFGGKLPALEISFNYTAKDSRSVEGNSGVISAWHLTKVVAPDGEEILFDYGTYTAQEKEVLRHISNYNGNSGFWDQYDATFLDVRLSWFDRKLYYILYSTSATNEDYNLQKSLIKMAYLRKIETKLKTVSFSYLKRNEYNVNTFYTTQPGNEGTGTDFGAFAGKNFKYITSRVDKIVIQDKVGVSPQMLNDPDPLPVPKIEYKFNYEFYGNSTVGNRLFLKDITSNSLKYSFEYNRTAELQHPMTFAIDKWGYYNAQPNTKLVGINGVPVYGDGAEYETNFTYTGQVRTANPAVADVGILKKITYPTGGTTEFEFEGHKFKKVLKRKVVAPVSSLIPVWETLGVGEDDNAGGCRIKKIISKADASLPSQISEYKYIKDYNLNPNGPSSGLLTDYGVFRIRLDAPNSYYHDQVADQNIAMSNGFSESHICYSQVVEITGNGSEGFTKYSYTNPDNQASSNASPDNYITDPNKIRVYATGQQITSLANQMKRLARYSSRSSERGKLQKKEVYSASLALLRSEEYKYNESSTRFSEMTVGYEKIYNQMYTSETAFPGLAWFFQSFQIYHYHNNVSQIIEKTYANGQTLTQTTDLVYKGNSNPLLSEKTITKSDGAVYKSKYFYPEDRIGNPDFPASAGMVASNMVATVIEEQSLRNGILQETQKYIYSDVTGSGGYKPIKNFSLNHTISGAVAEEGMNITYYPDGNVKESLKKNDFRTRYLWDYKKTFPVAEVKNIESTDELSYTSFETTESGNQDVSQWTYNQGAVLFISPCPTGSNVYDLGTNTNSVSRSNLNPAKQYILSMWHNGSSVSAGGFPVVNTTTIGNWTYKEYLITGVTSISITGAGKVDEVRLYPKGSFMTTYAYQPLHGIISQCDANNRISYYVYDPMGRLTAIVDKDKKILKRICYNFYNQTINCSSIYFKSAPLSQTFTKNDCGAGYEGSQATYTVPSSAYLSSVSQTDANLQAQADMNFYGQAYANSHGVCTCTTNSCAGPDKKCINGVCETGVRKNKSSTFSKSTHLWTCTYVYQFSDCSVSQDYYETGTSACTTGGLCTDQ